MQHLIPGRVGVRPQNKYIVSFETASEVSGPLSRIGGAPSWLSGEAWPKDEFEPASMYFLSQIQLDDFIFPLRTADMAYIFIGSKPNRYKLCENNAVVFQSKGQLPPNHNVLDSKSARRKLRYLEDPNMESQFGFGFKFEPSSESPSNFDSENWNDEYWEAMSKPQIGGLPFFDPVDVDEAKSVLGDINMWRLLFFVNCDDEFPFLVPSGSPTYYVFTNEECSVGHVIGTTRI